MNEQDWGRRLMAVCGSPLIVTAVTELRDWSESRVVRLTARAADATSAAAGESVWYAKLARTGAQAELAIYSALATSPGFPAPVGRLLCGEDEPWLIIRQARGQQLADAGPADWTAAAAALAAFHERAAAGEWPTPAELPRLVEGLATLPERALAVSRRHIIDGLYTGINLAAIDRTVSYLLDRWPELAAEIAGYPQALSHGDCHSGNVFVSEDGIELIDWGAAQCGPGMLDLVALLDVAARMNEGIADPAVVSGAYWQALSEQTRRAYGDRRRALNLLSLVRAMQELLWFADTGEDYGERALRELDIIRAGLLRLAVVGAAKESLRQISAEPWS